MGAHRVVPPLPLLPLYLNLGTPNEKKLIFTFLLVYGLFPDQFSALITNPKSARSNLHRTLRDNAVQSYVLVGLLGRSIFPYKILGCCAALLGLNPAAMVAVVGGYLVL